MLKQAIKILLLFSLIACSKSPTLTPPAEPTLEGDWELTVYSSLEEYPLWDTTFYNEFKDLNVRFLIEDNSLYTVQNDTLRPIPLLGFIYQNSFILSIEDRDGFIYIGGEKWNLILLTINLLVLETTTDYGMMGSQLRQFVLTK
tara:strand:+ start:1249 stop:1680 length:432 start_codon:yes stop_codon:yes gene_type:complete